MNIQPLSQVSSVTLPSASIGNTELASRSSDSSFSDVMVSLVKSANQDMNTADQAISDYGTGKTNDVNSVVMASVKADLSFRFMMEMRNRVTESYQDLSRMQF